MATPPNFGGIYHSFFFLFSFLFIYVANRDWVIMASHMARVCGELSVSMVVSMVVSVVDSIDATPQCAVVLALLLRRAAPCCCAVVLALLLRRAAP